MTRLEDLPPQYQEQVRRALDGQSRLPGHQGSGGGQNAAVIGSEAATAKGRKYGNRRTTIDGHRFDSALEARYYQELKLRRAAGEVAWFLLQPSFRLPGDVRYRADFLVVLASGGVQVVDCKGFLTRESANKIKQVAEIYGVEVQLWRGT